MAKGKPLGRVAGVPALLTMLAAIFAWNLAYSRIDQATRVASLGPQTVPAESHLASESPVGPVLVAPHMEPAASAAQMIVVTGYSSDRLLTDDSPSVTARNTTPRRGCLALSRDLLRTFNKNAPFDFGDWVLLPGIGVFIVEDTMHERWRHRGDIWFPNRSDAVQWGRRRLSITRVQSYSEKARSLFATDPLIAMGRRPALFD